MVKYKINLQFFAEEKTEKPTPKRRREAKEKGQVLQSKEVNSAFILIFAFVGLKIFGSYMYDNLIDFSRKTLMGTILIEEIFTQNGIHKIIMETILVLAQIVAPIILLILVVGVTINYMQVGFLFTTKAIEFKLNRINPIEGFKRIFSKRAFVELVKSSIKVFLIGYIVYKFTITEISNILNLYEMNLESIVKYIADISYKVGIRISLILIFLAFFDYLYQWWEHEKNLKMSKKEIKEEYKQTEGDPQIKSKIKEKQRQMAMMRMMQEVPKADVIITNPTHFAIALKYDKDKFDAPYVLAKGQDLMAEKIKEIGKSSSIPIVENKPLAQALYHKVEIGDVIPEELYQAVAEILAYVYSLNS